MTKSREKLAERRSFIRLREPIGITYTISGDNRLFTVTATDISADGVRFQTANQELKEGDALEMKFEIPAVANPVHAKGVIIWRKRLSLEDNAPIDTGAEIREIEEDNKNTFLKFLCDLIYDLPEDRKNAKNKKN